MAKLHWADQVASDMVRQSPDQGRFVLAAGITPSGVVHVGNFREVITVDLIARALKKLGKEVRFLFSWDDFDVFRKVPKDLPEGYAEHLRKSVSEIPDPLGKSDSYAGQFVDRFQLELGRVGIAPDFIRQSKQYKSGAYAEGISRAIEARAVIAEALNRHRQEPLKDDWLPISGFCGQCLKDDLKFNTEEAGIVSYACQGCGHQETVKLSEGGRIKLAWRIDWPMRWGFEKVDFEPGGKDHSTAGGSYDTGKEIAKRVYGVKAPRYVGYEFVRAKGQGGKLSSSSGGVITVSDCLEIYQPEILRWLFVKYAPRSTLQISFDDDVIQAFEEFDRALRAARKVSASDTGPKSVARRTLELSCLNQEHSMLRSQYEAPPFRRVTTVLQAFDGDQERAMAYFADVATTEQERQWLKTRVQCAWRWIELYAPDEFRFLIRKEPKKRELSTLERAGLEKLVQALRSTEISEATIISSLKEISKMPELNVKEFFPVAYDLLIGKEKGPKLSTLLASIEPARALTLLEPSLS